MKITKRQLRRVINEEKARLLEAGPSYPKHMFPDRVPKSPVRTESGEPQSYHDLATRLNAATLMLEDLTMDYVDSGWLADGDHASLARDVDNAFTTTDRLALAVMGLAQSMDE